jgi:hypothetical protein
METSSTPGQSPEEERPMETPNTDLISNQAALYRGKKLPSTQAEKDRLVHEAHDMGHFGVQAVFSRIWHQGFWWPHIREDIRKVIDNCSPCLRHNAKHIGYHPLTSIESTEANDHWAIDLIDMPDGFILVVIDIATRFVMLKALDSKRQEVIAWALWEFICLVGPPRIIQSDNGREFVNNILKALLQKVGTSHRLIASYHPRANGAVERANADIEQILRKMCSHVISEWRKFVPFAMLAYNSRISTRIQSMPFALMFGREPNPFVSYTHAKSFPVISPQELKKHWDDLKENTLPAVYEGATERQHALTERFNATHKIVDSFKPGDHVMVNPVTHDSKWNAKWEGPLTVLRRNQGGSYICANTLGEEEPYRFPPSHMVKIPGYNPSSEESFEIEAILSHRTVNNTREYLVRWKDHELPDRWLSVESFDSPAIIERYHKSLAKAMKTNTRPSMPQVRLDEENGTDHPPVTIAKVLTTGGRPLQRRVAVGSPVQSRKSATRSSRTAVEAKAPVRKSSRLSNPQKLVVKFRLPKGDRTQKQQAPEFESEEENVRESQTSLTTSDRIGQDRTRSDEIGLGQTRLDNFGPSPSCRR